METRRVLEVLRYAGNDYTNNNNNIVIFKVHKVSSKAEKEAKIIFDSQLLQN